MLGICCICMRLGNRHSLFHFGYEIYSPYPIVVDNDIVGCDLVDGLSMAVVGFAVDCLVILDGLVEDAVEVVILNEAVVVDFLAKLIEADGTTEAVVPVFTAEDDGSTVLDVPVSTAAGDPGITVVDALVLTIGDDGSIETDNGSTDALGIAVEVNSSVEVDVCELIADDDDSEEVGVFFVLVEGDGSFEIDVFVILVEEDDGSVVIDGPVTVFETDTIFLNVELGCFVEVDDFVDVYVDGVGETLLSQCEPVQSFEHTHENIPGVFVQEPLFKHGNERHSSISFRQCGPVNPVSQLHLKLPCVFTQLP